MTKDEEIRGVETALVNSAIKSEDPEAERARLTAEYGEVWDTTELQRDFTVQSFAAPYCFVTRKSDNVKGCLAFQHMPRFYFFFHKI